MGTVESSDKRPPPYVVRIFGKTRECESYNGTGFIVSQTGHIITCLHVVSKAAEIKVQLPYSYKKPGRYKVLRQLESDDLALLESLVPLETTMPCAPLHSSWKGNYLPYAVRCQYHKNQRLAVLRSVD